MTVFSIPTGESLTFAGSTTATVTSYGDVAGVNGLIEFSLDQELKDNSGLITNDDYLTPSTDTHTYYCKVEGDLTTALEVNPRVQTETFGAAVSVEEIRVKDVRNLVKGMKVFIGGTTEVTLTEDPTIDKVGSTAVTYRPQILAADVTAHGNASSDAAQYSSPEAYSWCQSGASTAGEAVAVAAERLGKAAGIANTSGVIKWSGPVSIGTYDKTQPDGGAENNVTGSYEGVMMRAINIEVDLEADHSKTAVGSTPLGMKGSDGNLLGTQDTAANGGDGSGAAVYMNLYEATNVAVKAGFISVKNDVNSAADLADHSAALNVVFECEMAVSLSAQSGQMTAAATINRILDGNDGSEPANQDNYANQNATRYGNAVQIGTANIAAANWGQAWLQSDAVVAGGYTGSLGDGVTGTSGVGAVAPFEKPTVQRNSAGSVTTNGGTSIKRLNLSTAQVTTLYAHELGDNASVAADVSAGIARKPQGVTYGYNGTKSIKTISYNFESVAPAVTSTLTNLVYFFNRSPDGAGGESERVETCLARLVTEKTAGTLHELLTPGTLVATQNAFSHSLSLTETRGAWSGDATNSVEIVPTGTKIYGMIMQCQSSKVASNTFATAGDLTAQEKIRPVQG